MRNIIVLFIFVISVVSCTSSYKIYEVNRHSDQQHFYILDTISIDSPIVICYNNVYYMTSKDKLNRESNNSSILEDTEVFLYDGEQFGIYYYMDNEKDLKKNYCTYDQGRKGLVRISDYKIGKKKVPVYSFRDKIDLFLLCLVNVNYFNLVNSGFITTDKECRIIPIHIKDSNSLNHYMKMAFPLCNQ